MVAIAAALLSTRVNHQDLVPVLWLDLKGDILVNGQPVSPKVNQGVTALDEGERTTYNFNGPKSGILFGDHPAMKLNGNMTVAVWIFPRSYAPNGAQSEILFRGDDRYGFDPYCLALENDGTINFNINDEKGAGMGVKAEISLNRWSYVTASLNQVTGELAMWINGFEVAYAHTAKRPFLDLLPQYTPGVGVGNVQNNLGPHNQPFNGMLADLRLYDKVLTPAEVGYVGSGAGGIQP